MMEQQFHSSQGNIDWHVISSARSSTESVLISWKTPDIASKQPTNQYLDLSEFVSTSGTFMVSLANDMFWYWSVFLEKEKKNMLKFGWIALSDILVIDNGLNNHWWMPKETVPIACCPFKRSALFSIRAVRNNRPVSFLKNKLFSLSN